MKRSSLLSLAAVAAVAGRASAAEAPQKIAITVGSTEANQAAPIVALQRGYFAEEGLDVSISMTGGGVSTPALLSGTIDGTGSSAAALTAILKGAPLRIVMVVSGTPTYQLWATTDIKTLADLKGKNIGIATRGDTTEIATRLLLQSAGVPPDSVGYTPLGFGSSIGAVLTTGALAAAVLPSEARATMEEKGGLKNDHMLVNYSGTVHMPYAGFAMSAKTLYGDPALARKMMRAIVKGSRYVKAFKTQTVAMLQKQGNGDLRALEAGYDVSLPALTRDLTVPDDLIKSDIAVRAGLLGLTKDQLPPIDKIYDFSLVRSINAELNASRWRPTV